LSRMDEISTSFLPLATASNPIAIKIDLHIIWDYRLNMNRIDVAL
jgi:hypothetical protein